MYLQVINLELINESSFLHYVMLYEDDKCEVLAEEVGTL